VQQDAGRVDFFPGLLWQLSNYTGQSSWAGYALNWTAGISSQQYNTGTHDVGFMVLDSFGLGYDLGGISDYRSVVLNAAKSLSTRYNPTVGCTMSWNPGHSCRDDPSVATNFSVIIDNMMNLELLFWAARNGGDPNFKTIAISHADQTRMNHVRTDGSTFHVVDYNPNTGAVVIKCTAQGYHDNSTWSRGQAWCVYGFTMTYRETGLQRFLDTAEACADYFISHLPNTYGSVPLWDFDWDGDTGLHYRDSSAAAIAASGLLELSTFSLSESKAQSYHDAAVQIINSLNSTNYLGLYDQTEGVLLHATGAYMSNSEVDVSLIYADYYLLESLRRLAKWPSITQFK